jgi:metallo-beta-lactamase family protein
MQITFYGACREVTGSNILVETNGKKILLDCGLYQGYKLSEERNYSPLPYDPTSIDFVVIGHAHLDHTGRLPKLAREGFTGRIYSTAPTKELTRLVLEDCEKLMREEAGRDNHPPLYNSDDIEKALGLFETIGYEEMLEISPGIALTFKNAGHILGSAVTILESGGKKLVYTSDLGNTPSMLLEPPGTVDFATYVISESTYGGKEHEETTRRGEKLSQIINATIAAGGVLLIPSFAVERTQELLHDIEDFCTLSRCEKPSFFLDSPLASKVTAVFKKYPELLNKNVRLAHIDNDFFGLERLKITSTPEQSQAIDESPNPKVIIAGSGMMNGGRILFHAQKYLGDPKNTILFAGYQAMGTIGRKILDGEREVRIYGKKVHIRAGIESIRSYSSHADLPQLIAWLGKIKNPRKIFLVHGEAMQQLVLSKSIEQELKIETIIPQQGESFAL